MKTTKEEAFIEKVIKTVQHEKKASTTFLREKFEIGYTRANRIIGILEARGIVGPARDSESREVFDLTSPTYRERSKRMEIAAADQEVQVISATYDRFLERGKVIKKETIAAANDMREMGIHLRGICGHEQMKLEFWNEHCESKLPFDFSTAKIFIATSHKMPAAAKTIEEAVHFVQQALVAADQLELPERVEMQGRSTVNVVEKFFREFTLMKVPFAKIIRSRPMEDWEPKALENFIDETEWLDKERHKAQDLLAEAHASHEKK